MNNIINDIEKAILSLTMCRELMLFNPLNGEEELYEFLNQDNKDLYDACGVAISELENKLKVLKENKNE